MAADRDRWRQQATDTRDEAAIATQRLAAQEAELSTARSRLEAVQVRRGRPVPGSDATAPCLCPEVGLPAHARGRPWVNFSRRHVKYTFWAQGELRTQKAAVAEAADRCAEAVNDAERWRDECTQLRKEVAAQQRKCALTPSLSMMCAAGPELVCLQVSAVDNI